MTHPAVLPDSTRPSRPRRGRTRRGRRVKGVTLVAVVGIAITTIVVLMQGTRSPATPACIVTAGQPFAPYSLSPDQAQNASIIAAVGFKDGMPDHAVTVALAAALQESGLVNLPYGDRDSVGLFQQRPSEGWGTNAQLLDPAYAAGAFYQALSQVQGWQSMSVTEAAQAVQRSAAPDAYASWETQARAMAVVLTGEVPAGLTCRAIQFSGAAPPASGLGQALATEMGSNLLGTAVSANTGWRVATWAVSHASNYHVGQVSFAGLTWQSSTGKWNPDRSGAPTDAVTVTPAPA